jgi:hypothetical protein
MSRCNTPRLRAYIWAETTTIKPATKTHQRESDYVPTTTSEINCKRSDTNSNFSRFLGGFLSRLKWSFTSQWSNDRDVSFKMGQFNNHSMTYDSRASSCVSGSYLCLAQHRWNSRLSQSHSRNECARRDNRSHEFRYQMWRDSLCAHSNER